MSASSLWNFSDLIYSADLVDVKIKGLSSALKDDTEAFAALRAAVDTAAAEDFNAAGGFANGKKKNFIISHAGQRFRVAIGDDAERSKYYYLRRVEPQIISLADQGYAKDLTARLMERRQGLIVFSGGMGQGKTSAASAFVSEWLQTHGGHAETLEDPPEYMIHGWHGQGLCIQRTVETPILGDGIAETMRHCAPDIIYVGELRFPSAARQAVIASANGHTVVTTVHAGNVVDAIWRLVSLADGGGGESLVPVLANGLSLLIHQRLERAGNVMTLKTWYVDFDSEATLTPLRSCIRNRVPEGIRDYLIEKTCVSRYGTDMLNNSRTEDAS